MKILHSILFLTVLFTCLQSFGALTLQINTIDQLFAISGSDTGTMEQSFDFDAENTYTVEWQLNNLGNPNGNIFGFVTYDNDITFSASTAVPGNESSFYDTDLVSNFGSGGHLSITLSVIQDTGGSGTLIQTITGSGVFQSYASMNANTISRVEAAIGQSLPLNDGSGFSSMDVVAVPEPVTTITGFAILGFILVLVRKRFCRNNGVS